MPRTRLEAWLGTALLVYCVGCWAAWPGPAPDLASGWAWTSPWSSLLLPPDQLAYAAARQGHARLLGLDRAQGGDIDLGAARPADLYWVALEADPASAHRWADWADALLRAGRVERALAASRHSIELGPRIAPVLLRAVYLRLAAGERDDALAVASSLLAEVREYDQELFNLFARMGIGPQRVSEKALGHGAQAHVAFFDHLLGSGDPAALELVWSRLVALGADDERLWGAYLAALVTARRGLRAYEIKRLREAEADPTGSLEPEESRIFNGGFERESRALPLEWRMLPHSGVSAARDCEVAYGGRCSMRLDFRSAADEAYQHLVQPAALPAGRWRLSARVRSHGLDTAQGVGLWIVDRRGEPSSASAATTVVSGTGDWSEVVAEFALPEAAPELELRVFRRPSTDRLRALRATVWIDQVTLVRANGAAVK